MTTEIYLLWRTIAIVHPILTFLTKNMLYAHYVPNISNDFIFKAKVEPIPPKKLEVVIEIIQGLPHLTVPLPSRNEPCIFVLKPVTHTIGDLLAMLKTEDPGNRHYL